MIASFTSKQGRYLAFIHWYTRINGQPPAESDLQRFFQVSAPSVHQMILSLANKGLIERTPQQARTIRVLLSAQEVPDLDTGEPPVMKAASLSEKYPAVTEWVEENGWGEIGYDYNTGTFARAIDEGGMLWGGGRRHMSLDDALPATGYSAGRPDTGMAVVSDGFHPV